MNFESVCMLRFWQVNLAAQLRALEGDIATFQHGHFGRILGYGHQRAAEPAIMLWNARIEETPES